MCCCAGLVEPEKSAQKTRVKISVKKRGASGISGGFSIEDSVIAFEVHGPTKQFDEVYED